MRRSRFTEEQIIGILKEHEAGVPVADLCRKHGVSDGSIYKWKARFGGMDVSEAKRLKAISALDIQIEKLVERVVEAKSPSVIKTYERKIMDLEQRKLLLAEKVESLGQSIRSFDEMFELALEFISSPWDIWASLVMSPSAGWCSE